MKGLLSRLPLFALLASAGCATVAVEVEPPRQIPAEFSRNGAEPLPVRWWTSLGDAALNALVEEALAGNFGLAAARARLAQAEAVARREGAPLIPSVDLEASALRSRTRSAGESRSAGDYTAGVVAAYELDLWGRVRAGRDAARLDAEGAREDLAAAAVTLSATLARAWYELAEAQAQQRVLERQVESNEQVLELVTLRFRRGSSGAADVFRQRQLLEATRGDLVLERARAQTLRHGIAVLVGHPPRAGLPLGQATLIEPPPLPATGVPFELIRSRPDVRSAARAVQAADRRVAAAIADRLPRVSVAARTETGASRASDLFDDWFANLAANLLAPVVDGGSRRAEVDRSRAVLSEAVNAYGDAVLVSLREVEDALEREARQVELLASLAAQLETAQHVIDRTRDSYARGQLDYLRVLDALTSKQSLERRYQAAYRERIGFRIDLGRALSGSWELPQRSEAATPGHRLAVDFGWARSTAAEAKL